MEETENGSPSRKYTAGNFEGPLDLLWSLIRENKINIYDIPIAEITEQFLDYLDYAVELNLQDLSEFYLWAAKLVCIKSRMLLPVENSLCVSIQISTPCFCATAAAFCRKSAMPSRS